MNKKIKKKDIIFSLLLFLIAISLLFAMKLYKKNDGKTVRIQIDGEEYSVYSLFEDKEIIIEEKRGKNIVKIEAGKVSMIYADCPDQYCVHHAPIHDSYEPIVCLPHRLVVEIK